MFWNCLIIDFIKENKYWWHLYDHYFNHKYMKCLYVKCHRCYWTDHHEFSTAWVIHKRILMRIYNYTFLPSFATSNQKNCRHQAIDSHQTGFNKFQIWEYLANKYINSFLHVLTSNTSISCFKLINWTTIIEYEEYC